MNKLKKILSLVLTFVLLLTCLPSSLAEGEAEATEAPAAAEEEAAIEVEFPDELIVGHPTITNGDFFTEMFGNNTADIDVRALIHGYNLVNWDQNQGTYVLDPSVVRAAEAYTDEQGNKIYDLTLADNLYYSDGTPITAWDYAFSLLLMMSPEIEEIGGKIYRAEHLMGFDQYIATRRKIIAGEPLVEGPEGDVDYLSGVTVLSDHQIRFFLDAQFLPYFFELGLLMTVPYPISVIAPGCKVVSGYVDPETGDPLGIKIVNEDENAAAPVYTAELLKKTILDPETGYNTFPSVVSGPYVIKSWDGVTGHFEINEQFKGAWMENNLPGEDGAPVANQVLENAKVHGNVVADTDSFGNEILNNDGEPIYLVKPTIRKIAFTVADNDTMIEQLADEELHLVNKVTYQEPIQKGSELRGEGTIASQNYPRIGLSFLTFTYEWPTVNDMEVRQAIAWCMDRDALTQRYCGPYGLVMDGYYGLEQWEYKIVDGRMSYPVNFLPSLDALGTKITESQEEERNRKKKLRFMYYENDAEMEACVAAWDMLRKRWKDDDGNTLLVHYTVDIDEANRLLDKAGWVLNKAGEAYKAGTDEVRCKKINDELVPLELKMMYPKGNHMIEFMQEENMFVDNLAKAGIKLEFVAEPMEELLRYYYREKERTTDMIYLATNFHVIVDPSITYSTDTSVGHKVWNNTYSDDKALFDDAVAMRKTEPGSYYEYVEKWMTFQERYNTVLPTIPIYSNIYFDFYTPLLQNYNITNNVTWSQAILPAYFGLPEVAEEEAAEGEEDLEGSLEFE